MLRRLRSLIPRSRTFRWVLVALVCGPIVLLGLLALSSMLLRFEIEIDLAKVGYAVALVIVAITAYLIVRYRQQPKDSLTVGYNYKLVQPVLPIGRYSFTLEVFYEQDVKGERRQMRQALIELKFKKADHPDILAWCCSQISGQLAKHGRLAAERFPGSQILLGPEPTPEQLAERVETEDEEGEPA